MREQFTTAIAQLQAVLPELERYENGNAGAGRRVNQALKSVNGFTWDCYNYYRNELERDRLVRRGEVLVFRLPHDDKVIAANLWVSDFAAPDMPQVFIHKLILQHLRAIADFYRADLHILKGYVPPEQWSEGGRKGKHTRGLAVRFLVDGVANEQVFSDVQEGRLLVPENPGKVGNQLGFGITDGELLMDLRKNRRLWIVSHNYQRYKRRL